MKHVSQDETYASRQASLSIRFSVVVLLALIAFIGMFTIGRAPFSTEIVPGVTWCVVVEPTLIVFALLVSAAYVVASNRIDASTSSPTDNQP
ncbi:hypothetical protein WQE_05252 [Paraburkholderia hospita]|uniref:DUF997 family protein n=1 Tax=Paraburkholderia hospita TaxID=169430 RepID=A0ABN0FTN1_9BURK|nr:hypothetical protein WQE_05252 [Paraburkholderia hospita]